MYARSHECILERAGMGMSYRGKARSISGIVTAEWPGMGEA